LRRLVKRLKLLMAKALLEDVDVMREVVIPKLRVKHLDPLYIDYYGRTDDPTLAAGRTWFRKDANELRFTDGSLCIHVPSSLVLGCGVAFLRRLKVNPDEAITIRTAEATGEGYWVGAPHVFYDIETEKFYLCYRRRNPDERGHTAYIAESKDGVNFTDIWSAAKTDFISTATSLERASLLRNPITGKWQYFITISTSPGFAIYKLADADSPDLLDPATTIKVLDHGTSGKWDETEVKDPVVFSIGGYLFMLYEGFSSTTGKRQTGLAYSINGESWTKYADNPIISTGGAGAWDEDVAVATSVLILGGAWVLLYKGRSGTTDPAFVARTGVAVWPTPLSGKATKITVNEPFLSGTDPTYYTFKYACAIVVKGKLFVYYEHGKPDGSFDLVVNVVSLGI